MVESSSLEATLELNLITALKLSNLLGLLLLLNLQDGLASIRGKGVVKGPGVEILELELVARLELLDLLGLFLLLNLENRLAAVRGEGVVEASSFNGELAVAGLELGNLLGLFLLLDLEDGLAAVGGQGVVEGSLDDFAVMATSMEVRDGTKI